MNDPDQKPKLHIDIDKPIEAANTGDELLKGKGITDECINCHLEIVSTGTYTNYDEYDGFGGIPSRHVPVKNYRWVHAATRISKCATGDRYAAGTKMPPQEDF